MKICYLQMLACNDAASVLKKKDQTMQEFEIIVRTVCKSVSYERQLRATLLKNNRYFQTLLGQ